MYPTLIDPLNSGLLLLHTTLCFLYIILYPNFIQIHITLLLVFLLTIITAFLFPIFLEIISLHRSLFQCGLLTFARTSVLIRLVIILSIHLIFKQTYIIFISTYRFRSLFEIIDFLLDRLLYIIEFLFFALP